MTQEEKELLLKDICCRLPYGLVLDVDTADWKAPQGHIQLKIEGMGFLFKDMSLIINGSYYGENIKPYLRPMSSMTDKELVTFLEIRGMNLKSEELKSFRKRQTAIVLTLPSYSRHIDWLNAHHFDYRGLIEKGLALAAPKDMYQ